MKKLWGVRHLRYWYLSWRQDWCWRHCKPWSHRDPNDDGPDSIELIGIWRGEG